MTTAPGRETAGPASTLERAGDIRGIQFLRAIAALMVVAHHARHYFVEGDDWTGFGSRGVDIFFVISGFIMVHTTRGFDPAGDRRQQAREFLSKRILRVVPLYWIALLWTAKRDLLSGAGGADFLLDLAFVPHFHATYVGSIFPVLIPGWTINYEMFFYALFAASLLFGRWRLVVLGATFIGLVLAGIQMWSSAPVIFYTRTVVLEFLFGVLVYECLSRWPRPLPAPWAAAVSAASLAVLAIDNGDEWRGLLDGPFAALLVWSFVQWTGHSRLRLLHALGDASYSIYLFHLATLAISQWLLRRTGIVAATPANIVAAISLQVVVAAACGLVIHRLLERPLIETLRRGFLARGTRKLPSGGRGSSS